MRKSVLRYMVILSIATVPLLALGGIEGTMEYALDAPWRIEPYENADGGKEYGAIPIQVSVHDTDIIGLDSPGRTLGNFCELTVEEKAPTVTRRRRYDLDYLAEIERSDRWRSKSLPAPEWTPREMGSVLRHTVCKPAEAADRCERVRHLSDSAEWHAVAWYWPATRTPGSDVPLTLTAMVTTSPRVPCSSTDDLDFITLRNHVTVHLAEAPLPRFDNRWLYGDLHYHSQGTDNEGESAYNYRGVIRAMGALGLDFVLAAEHASNSRQVLDAEVDATWCGIKGRLNPVVALRDLSLARFRFLREHLHGARGANRTAALDGPNGRLPQGYLSHGVIPQIFLGGELDAIPETETDDSHISYGNGLSYDLHDLMGGWKTSASWCSFPAAPYYREPAANGYLVKDVQGLNSVAYGREHLVYLPSVGTDDNAFVASNTGDYGGARRRLTEAHGDQLPLLPEIEQKGYAFLAHPLNAGSGGPGPDGPPWSDFMIEKAWHSSRVLGLQFWNEPTRLKTNVGSGSSAEIGYYFDGSYEDHEAKLAQSERWGFSRRRSDGTNFELFPYFDRVKRTFGIRGSGSLESRLHHGAFTWDRWLLRGLDSTLTHQLASWLPTGEPRRFFIAGGSDAHGDLNYRRTGYMTGTEAITDVAIAKVRNLVFAGDPTLPRDENIPPEWAGKPAERHSHDQVVEALAAGRFAVTDGPALRIIVDRNRNNVIDDGDTPMGGMVELKGEEELPLIVQWRSTAEFGAVVRLSLYLGVRNDRGGIDGASRVYAPALHGPRNGAELPLDTVVESYSHSGRMYARMQDNYWRDPTGLLEVSLSRPFVNGRRLVPSLDEEFAVVLPLPAFEARRQTPGDRFYVRAFIETELRDREACRFSTLAGRQGACIRHYALTNPIWAITNEAAPLAGGASHELTWRR